VELLVATWALSSGRMVRSLDGLPIYGQLNLDRSRTIALHIPLNITHPMLVPSLRMLEKTYNWTHIATSYSASQAEHTLSFRHIPDALLGYDNNGSMFEFKAQSVRSTTKRVEEKEDDLYVNYQWEDGNELVWEELNTFLSSVATTADYIGSTGANWMEENEAQVACFCPGVENNGGISGSARGVLAWNYGSEYPWQDGQSGSYMDQC
jgi:hypothetical protein